MLLTKYLNNSILLSLCRLGKRVRGEIMRGGDVAGEREGDEEGWEGAGEREGDEG